MRFPYGGTLAARFMLVPQVATNTGYVLSLGNPDVHKFALRQEMTIQVSFEEEFSRGNVVVRVRGRGANVIVQPNAHRKLTATNNYVLE